MSDIIHL